MMRKETERWDTEWSGRDVVDDIAMRDFFNGRQFILKFFPWWGKAVEAGCGLGRYVFYLSALGREIVGVDFSGESIRRAKHFAETNGLPSNLFDQADIDQLDFKENTFSYYISLGVLEHFFQGPERALAEAFRVLAPGGIAIVTTPNKFSLSLLKGWLRRNIKRILLRDDIHGVTPSVTLNSDGSFFQYWYNASEIGSFIRKAGFRILEQDRIDLHFPLWERAGTSSMERWLFSQQNLLNSLENSPLRMFGVNTVTVAVKPGKLMHCFCCGNLKDEEELLKSRLRIPVCVPCRSKHAAILRAYQGRTRSRYGADGDRPAHLSCAYCGVAFEADPLFGVFGMDKYACTSCMNKPHVRGELSALHVKLTWKPYLRG